MMGEVVVLIPVRVQLLTLVTPATCDEPAFRTTHPAPLESSDAIVSDPSQSITLAPVTPHRTLGWVKVNVSGVVTPLMLFGTVR